MPESLRDLLPLLSRMERRREDPPTLAELSREAGRSPAYFQKSFKRLVGESPKRYGNRLRLEQAAAALITGRAPILDIALDAGFDSHEGFSRAFRRHFGCSPSSYRRRAAGLDSRAAEQHQRLLRRVGPCITLLHRTAVDQNERRPQVSYSIERHERDATPFLFIRRRVPMTELSATFGEVFPRVFAYVTGTGLAMAGRPTVVYREMSPGMATVEAGIPVAAASTGEGDIECGELPGGPAAVTIHRGPYERLGEAHAAVGAWVAEHGLEQAGPPWESYITDPTEEPDPEQWQTEVVWPLSS